MSTTTVLMPVYNAEKYLKEAIDSILNQTDKNFDFLIINDGSQDTSEKIILSYSDPRIRYIKNEENLGIVATLNRGIDLIDTDYIVRMDADDLSVKERIEVQKAFMDDNPSIGVSSGFIQLFGNESGIWRVPLLDEELKASLLFGSPIMHPAAIIRTSILKRHNIYYRFTYPHMEDYDLWYRLKDVTKFANLNQILLYYRYQGQNITIKHKETLVTRVKEIYKVILHDLGIEAEEEELLLHYGFGKSTLLPSTINIGRYKKWLEKLIEYNNKLKVYSIESLEKLITSKWSGLFYILPPYGFRVVLSYVIHSKMVRKKHILYYAKYTINRFLSKF